MRRQFKVVGLEADASDRAPQNSAWDATGLTIPIRLFRRGQLIGGARECNLERTGPYRARIRASSVGRSGANQTLAQRLDSVTKSRRGPLAAVAAEMSPRMAIFSR